MTMHTDGSGSALFAGTGVDLRHALRLLWKSKGITAATLLTLALCIGATTAIFSSVYALMIKPLPFHEPQAIVELYSSAVKVDLPRMPANVPMYLDYSKNATSYESVGLCAYFNTLFGEEGSQVRLFGARVTAEMFTILRVQPLRGTFFTKEENKQGADKVVVLTQSFWKSQFDENPDVIGQDLRLDGENYKIIGIAPRVFEALDVRVKFITPLSWPPQAESPQGRYGVGINLYARLKPGVTAGQADAEAKELERRFVEASPPQLKQFVERSGMTMNVGGVQEQRVKPVRPTLFVLQAAVACVLLIGCLNVANLLLARSNARQSELAIRSALGASRGTIARQLLLESLLLTGLGAFLGVAVAWGLLKATNFYLPKFLPQSLPATLDLHVLGFAVGLSLLMGLFIGLIPVVHILRTNLAEVIQRSSRGASSARGVRLLGSALVILQVVFALVLLTAAGLLVQSFAKAIDVDPGFDPEKVVTGRLALPQAHRASDEAAKNFRERLIASMREIPGVTHVALSSATPFQGGLPINAFSLFEDTLPPGAAQPGAYQVTVTPGYAEALGLRLLEGRFYEEADTDPKRKHFVVDQSFARKFFPNGAIGGRFAFGPRPEKPEDWPTIIGVVKDIPHNGVAQESSNPFIYRVVQGGRPGGLTVFLRSERPANDVLAAMREKIKGIDPTIVIFDTGPMDKVVDSSYDNRRATMLLLVALSGVALFLSALGIYGVLAYDVSQRTREIGVRGAIGASQGQIVGLIMRQGLWKTGIGIVVGLVASVLIAKLLEGHLKSLLFEVKAVEPLVYGGVAVVLLLVALLASYLPARRASRIDPLVALREE